MDRVKEQQQELKGNENGKAVYLFAYIGLIIWEVWKNRS
jgi:hypothetical protein